MIRTVRADGTGEFRQKYSIDSIPVDQRPHTDMGGIVITLRAEGALWVGEIDGAGTSADSATAMTAYKGVLNAPRTSTTKIAGSMKGESLWWHWYQTNLYGKCSGTDHQFELFQGAVYPEN